MKVSVSYDYFLKKVDFEPAEWQLQLQIFPHCPGQLLMLPLGSDGLSPILLGAGAPKNKEKKGKERKRRGLGRNSGTALQ